MTAAFRLCVCVCLGTGAPAACICTAGGARRARGARRSPKGPSGRGCLKRESSYFEVWKLCPLACAAARLGKPSTGAHPGLPQPAAPPSPSLCPVLSNGQSCCRGSGHCSQGDGPDSALPAPTGGFCPAFHPSKKIVLPRAAHVSPFVSEMRGPAGPGWGAGSSPRDPRPWHPADAYPARLQMRGRDPRTPVLGLLPNALTWG